MAPLPQSTIKAYITSLLKRNPLPTPSLTDKLSDLSPKAADLVARAQNLLPRATLADPGAGVTPPSAIPNKAVFTLFGFIGVGFVLTGIWFFFWAKNGGFYFKETDWDDYKSTVLRRKGPNGTTLSGASESTDLGGGSIVHGQSEKSSKWGRKKRKGMKRYKDYEDEESTQVTSSFGGSTLGSSEMSEIKHKARKEKKRKEKKSKKAAAMSEVGTDLGTEAFTVDPEEELDVGVREAVRAYRHEKPARVGGLNKESEASTWDGSARDDSTAASELLSHREKTPTSTPTKVRKERKETYTSSAIGIRKVVSTSEGNHSYWGGSSPPSVSAKRPLIADTDDHIKLEARKLQEKGRAARRDFSFQAGDDATTVAESERSTKYEESERSARREESERNARREESERNARREERERRRASRSPTKKLPGGFYEESEVGSSVSTDVGTKSYHHPIPGLSSTVGSDYAEERRKKRAGGGYRRPG